MVYIAFKYIDQALFACYKIDILQEHNKKHENWETKSIETNKNVFIHTNVFWILHHKTGTFNKPIDVNVLFCFVFHFCHGGQYGMKWNEDT